MIVAQVTQGYSQNVWLHGALTDYNQSDFSPYVYLLRSAPLRSVEMLDSVMVSSEGEFSFKAAPFGVTTLYHLRFGNGTPFVFMAAANERLKLNTSATDLFYGKAKIIGSEENEIYLQLETIWQRFLEAQQISGDAYEKVDYFDSKYTTRTEAIRDAYELKVVENNEAVRKLVDVHRGTFTADMLSQLYHVNLKRLDAVHDTAYDNNLAFQFRHYFDKMDLNEGSLVMFDRFYDRLDEYFANYVDASSVQGMITAVGRVMDQVKAPDNRSLIALYLSDRFRDIKQYELSEHVLTNYFEQECSFANSDVWNQKAESLKALQVGSVAPEIALPDMEGKNVKLSTLKGKKAILLYFWSSRCQYCTDALGELMDFYARNSPLGFEIYAVSLEENNERWKNYLSTSRPRWINVFDKGGTSGDTSRTYGLRGTPTYILLGEDMRIKLRTHDLHELFVNVNALLER